LKKEEEKRTNEKGKPEKGKPEKGKPEKGKPEKGNLINIDQNGVKTLALKSHGIKENVI